jgi:hypothetical protein
MLVRYGHPFGQFAVSQPTGGHIVRHPTRLHGRCGGSCCWADAAGSLTLAPAIGRLDAGYLFGLAGALFGQAEIFGSLTKTTRTALSGDIMPLKASTSRDLVGAFFAGSN